MLQPTKFELIDQSQDRQGARPRRAGTAARPRRRGDRMKERPSPIARVADKVGWRQISGPLFRKYVLLFIAVVCVALISNGIFEVWLLLSGAQGLVDPHSGRAGRRRRQGDRPVHRGDRRVRSAGRRNCHGRRAPSRRGASTGCGCCARSRRSPSWPSSMPPARSSSRCRGSPWTWWPARPTTPRTRNSSRRWRRRSITARSISAANPSPT